MALRGSGSRDRSSSGSSSAGNAAGSGAVPSPVRGTPRRRRRFFRRATPVEDFRADIPRMPREPEPGDGGAAQASSARSSAGVAAAGGGGGGGGRAQAGSGAGVGRGSGFGPRVGSGAAAGQGTRPDVHGDLLANVALRDLTLIESLLGIIEEAERDEQDPDRLGFLFRLDHLATRLRRSSENLLVLAGRDVPDGPDEPVPLLEVVRAAISESADYARVEIGRLPPVAIGPHAADDISHLLAELLDNALAMSPAHTTVTVSGSGASNTVLVVVDDDGIGIPVQRLAEYNTRLAAAPALDAAAARQMGLYVVASLAHRHGVYVQMQARPGGGTSVVAALPLSVLAALPAPPPSHAVPVAVAAVAGAGVAAGHAPALPIREASPMSEVRAPAGPRPWVDEATVADAWTPGPVLEDAAGPAVGGSGVADADADAHGEEPRSTLAGLPRRTRPTGWAEPPAPETEAAPADPQSVFDDLAAFDAGQRAAADAPAWEGPWES